VFQSSNLYLLNTCAKFIMNKIQATHSCWEASGENRLWRPSMTWWKFLRDVYGNYPHRKLTGPLTMIYFIFGPPCSNYHIITDSSTQAVMIYQ
jgi:hypothetical protein